MILDGKVVNEKIARELSAKIKSLDPKPKLVIIQVGDLAESNAYITRKKAFGDKIGAIVDHQRFPNDVTQQKLITHISSLNTDPSVTGIITQMPFPKHLDKDAIIEAINPIKDVDGLTSANLKLLWEGPSARHPEQSEGSRDSSSSTQNDKSDFSGFIPATTKGVITLLDHYKIPISGKHVIVLGRSFLVGKPTMLALLNRDATVTIAHSKSENPGKITKSADILVSAVGKPNLITKNYVHKNQIVVDVGITAVEPETGSDPADTRAGSDPVGNTRKLVGDVKFEEVSKIVKAISPVPGGVGPMTVASLFQNLLEAYQRQN